MHTLDKRMKCKLLAIKVIKSQVVHHQYYASSFLKLTQALIYLCRSQHRNLHLSEVHLKKFTPLKKFTITRGGSKLMLRGHPQFLEGIVMRAALFSFPSLWLEKKLANYKTE